MNKKTLLITGASYGIGKSLSLELCKNYNLILIARSADILNRLKEKIRLLDFRNKVDIFSCDLSNENDVIKLKQTLEKSYTKIDYLISAHGTLDSRTTLTQVNTTEWKKTIDVNLNANLYLIKHLEGFLNNSSDPRAIFFTSGTTLSPRPNWGAYGVSKYALEYLVSSWALENTQIKANLYDPGATKTTMRAKAYPQEDPNTLKEPSEITKHMQIMLSSQYQKSGAVERYSSFSN